MTSKKLKKRDRRGKGKMLCNHWIVQHLKYRGADKSLARPTFRCILFDGENISFDVSFDM